MTDGIVDNIIVALFIFMGIVAMIATPAAFIIGGIKMVQGGMNLMGKGFGALTGLAKRFGGSYEGSRGRKMRKEARERAKQKGYLERSRRRMEDPGIRGRFYRARTRARIGKAGASEMSESLYSAGQKLEGERMQQLDRRLTRNAAMALASGDRFDARAGTIKDGAGNVVTTLDAEDMAAVRYAQSTGAMGTTAGAKAVGAKLHALGDMSLGMNQNLVDMGRTAQDKSEINNALNQAAIQSGQLHLGYNALNSGGQILPAGLKAGSDPTQTAEGLKGIIASKGVAALPKEVYSGESFSQTAVRDALGSLYYSSQRDSFVRQTLSISEDKKLDGIAKALGITRTDLDAERKRVSREYRGG